MTAGAIVAETRGAARRRGRMLAGAVAVSLLALIAALPQPVRTAASSWQPPGFVRTVGGAGPAGVYAWGMAFNPVMNEIDISDYWNFYVRRYSLTGRQNGAFYQSASQRAGQPESVAVDPRNGDIYVAENGKVAGVIAHFDKSGNYIDQLDSRASYVAWITIDPMGHLFILNGHLSGSPGNPNQVQEYDLNNHYALLRRWGTYGSGPGQFITATGLATDAAGDLFVNDGTNLRVSEFDPSGNWIRDFGGPGKGVGQFVGDLRGIAVDQQNGWVYVVDGAGYKVEKFDTNGNSILDWGSQGTGPGQFRDGGRQVTVDGSGNVWVADYSNFRFEEFTSSGQFLAAYPQPVEPPAGGFFSDARDVAVNPGDGSVWVADVWSDRFQKFSGNGTFEGTWGYRASLPPYGMDYPRGIGVDPATGNVWVADTRDHYIRIYDESGNYITSLGSGLQSCAAGSFASPVDIQFFGGRAYVSDYWCYDVQILDAVTGSQVGTISGYNNGCAIDPATGNVYVVDQVYRVIREYTSSGQAIRTFGSSGTGNGQFTSPWADDILQGVLYVTDAQLNRVEAFDLSGNWLGQFGAKGAGTFQFNQPSGITHDSGGNLYVADANNDRIQVFSPNVALPSGDTTPPSLTMTSPTKGQTFPAAAVTIAGTASDGVAVGEVEVAIQDASGSKLWWNAGHATWQTAKIWNLAAFVCSAPGSCSWSSAFIGEQYGGTYKVMAQVIDTSGNAGVGPVVPFSVSAT